MTTGPFFFLFFLAQRLRGAQDLNQVFERKTKFSFPCASVCAGGKKQRMHHCYAFLLPVFSFSGRICELYPTNGKENIYNPKTGRDRVRVLLPPGTRASCTEAIACA